MIGRMSAILPKTLEALPKGVGINIWWLDTQLLSDCGLNRTDIFGHDGSSDGVVSAISQAGGLWSPHITDIPLAVDHLSVHHQSEVVDITKELLDGKMEPWFVEVGGGP
jgi:hypothetical protein